MLNIIARINKLKTLTKHYHANVNLEVENVIQIKCGTTINIDASAKIRNMMCAKIYYIWNPSTCTCGNGKYLESIINDSVVTCDENIGAVWLLCQQFLTSKKEAYNF